MEEDWEKCWNSDSYLNKEVTNLRLWVYPGEIVFFCELSETDFFHLKTIERNNLEVEEVVKLHEDYIYRLKRMLTSTDYKYDTGFILFKCHLCDYEQECARRDFTDIMLPHVDNHFVIVKSASKCI